MLSKSDGKKGNLEDYWLPKFQTSASAGDDASRNISTTFGHIERKVVFLELVEKFLPQSAASVLDVGCGSGTYFDEYRRWGLAINGVDFSSSQIEVARQRYPDASLHACVVEDSPASIQADLVVSIGVTQVVSDLDLFLKCLSDRLSKRGIAIVSCLNRGSIWPGGLTNPDLRFFRLHEIRSYLNRHFEEVECRRFYPLPGPFSLLRPLFYRLQVPLLNHGFMFVLKKKQ